VFKQIVEGLNYCHIRNIAHRDLKPENFLFLNKKSMNLKLIDFGLSFEYKENMREELKLKKETKLVGTSYYIAPEVIKGDYDQRCDIWSMGVILYILVTAVPPFDGENDKEIIEAVRKGHYTFDSILQINLAPEMTNVSSSLKDLIKKILVEDDKRLTIKQIFDHPWMVSKANSTPLKLKFNKMSNFSKFSKLKTLAVTYIASQLPEKDIEKLGALFKQIDANHDGFLTVDEIKMAL
jgi:calcium-dependent protein kinase